MSEEIKQLLQKTASKKTREDGLGEGDFFDPQDWFGGNFDDAFRGGQEDGEVWFARQLCDLLGLQYTTNE